MYPISIFFTQVYTLDAQSNLVVDKDKADLTIMLGDSPLSERYLDNRAAAGPSIEYTSSESPEEILKIINSLSPEPIRAMDNSRQITVDKLPKERTYSLISRIKEKTTAPPFL